MQIYWSLKSIPERASLPKEVQRRAWRRVYGKTFRHWQTWAGLFACGICAGAGARFGGVLGLSLVGAAVGGGIGGFIFSQAFIHVARRYYFRRYARVDSVIFRSTGTTESSFLFHAAQATALFRRSGTSYLDVRPFARRCCGHFRKNHLL